MAVAAGCDAVKFQKRTVEVVYTPEELAKPRENPFGPTNGDLKHGLEFEQEEYEEIDAYCKSDQDALVRISVGRGLGRLPRTVSTPATRSPRLR